MCSWLDRTNIKTETENQDWKLNQYQHNMMVFEDDAVRK